MHTWDEDRQGISLRIEEIKAERDAWIAANEESARVHLIEKNALCEAVKVLAEALEQVQKECRLDMDCNYPGDDGGCGGVEDCLGSVISRITSTALSHPAVKEVLR